MPEKVGNLVARAIVTAFFIDLAIIWCRITDRYLDGVALGVAWALVCLVAGCIWWYWVRRIQFVDRND